jgi:hypothetical protein
MSASIDTSASTPSITIEHIHTTLLAEINILIQQRDKHTKHSELWRCEDRKASALCWMFGPLTNFGIKSDITRCEHNAQQKTLMDAADMPIGISEEERA